MDDIVQLFEKINTAKDLGSQLLLEAHEVVLLEQLLNNQAKRDYIYLVASVANGMLANGTPAWGEVAEASVKLADRLIDAMGEQWKV